MKSRVYIETTIPSYLTARKSRDVVSSARQEITQEWWHRRRSRFEVYVSQVVIDEAQAGDSEAAERRIAVIADVSVLDITPEAVALAGDLVSQGSLPSKATVDALHIAIATIGGMDYLMTWNCAHIANAEMRHMIERVCRENGYRPSVICTPDELMGED